MAAKSIRRTTRALKIRYAVIGQGYISQAAVLPAFKHASANSALVALVSDDPTKRRALGRKYGVKNTFSYADYDACLQSGEIDAVFIALPNSMHCEYAVRAARAGIHVLCEKPMAINERECQEMIDAATEHHVKMMIAYRLHFEEANLKAVQLVKSGKIGEAKYFTSQFSMQVKPGNIRLKKGLGGGPLFDIGIYCINAARYIFQTEPEEVSAFATKGGFRRFAEVEESVSAIMRFPGERLASFTCSFGSADAGSYRIVGTKGDLVVEPAYEFEGELKHKLTIAGRTREKSFAARDQFSPEILYFSKCIQENKEPEPSGFEGLADVRIIRALYDSILEKRAIKLEPFVRAKRPTIVQEMQQPAVPEQNLVNAQQPFKE